MKAHCRARRPGSVRHVATGTRPSARRRAAARSACPLFDDPSEAAVVVVSVVILAAAPRHYATRAAIVRARRFHGVLAVIARLALRQAFLAILEGLAVLRIRERAAGLDEDERLARFGGQSADLGIGQESKGERAIKQRERAHPPHGCGGCLRRRCSSRSCFSVTGVGAPVRRSWPRWVFGKAMTSRIASAPAISVTRRSKPNAMPPCGGAPYCSASSRKPNFARCSACVIFIAANTFCWISERWMRTEPPPISQPFNTTS